VVSFFPRLIDEQHNEELEAAITKEELVVVNSFKKAKRPDLDGWNVKFYLSFYDLLKEELLRVIKEPRVFGALNDTFIAIIP
jgi:hypothetical protein